MCPYKLLGWPYLNFLQNLFNLNVKCEQTQKSTQLVKMAKKELKNPSFLLLFALLLLLATRSRCTAEASSRLRSTKTTTRELFETEQDYPGDVPSIPSDYDYNDFYRRQGDVPSPGIGH
ncbi:hypothetical protein HRI_002165300 [Hibiscus trionum]|uniref:Uncharacterized protein n=1 Tax=Hibiscus trionum TaxID=183268 RepID=A0A9W7HV77_HIBTR|nr:hypothetical protein HRI_002165300 [Hibiscus trionum]